MQCLMPETSLFPDNYADPREILSFCNMAVYGQQPYTVFDASLRLRPKAAWVSMFGAT